jgi:hypothetical protein
MFHEKDDAAAVEIVMVQKYCDVIYVFGLHRYWYASVHVPM